MIATRTQLHRLADYWSELAGESVTVDRTPNAFYGFASELAVLRIFALYQSNGDVHNNMIRIRQHATRGWFIVLRVM